MDMADFWLRADRISIIGGLIGIIGVACALVYYFVKLETRIDTLENQVRLIAVTPIPKPDPSQQSGSSESPVNPVIAACLDLVKRAADARRNNEVTAYLIEGYIKDYGCVDLMKAAVPRAK
jgi:hypothetical protein